MRVCVELVGANCWYIPDLVQPLAHILFGLASNSIAKTHG